MNTKRKIKKQRVKLTRCPLCRHKVDIIDEMRNLKIEEDIKGCDYCLFNLYYNFGDPNDFKLSWDLIMKFDSILNSLEMYSDSD